MTDQPPPNERGDSDLEIGAGALELFAPILGFLVGGPVGAVGVGAATGMVVGARYVLQRRLVRRIELLEHVVREMAAANLPALLERINSSDRAAVLAQLALEGAFSGTSDRQLTAAGMLFVEGALGSDRVAVEAEFAMRMVGQLSEAEIETLIVLERAQPIDEGGRMTDELAAELEPHISRDMINSVISTLGAKGLLRPDPPGFGGYYVSAFGRRVAAVLTTFDPQEAAG